MVDEYAEGDGWLHKEVSQVRQQWSSKSETEDTYIVDTQSQESGSHNRQSNSMVTLNTIGYQGCLF